MNDPHTATSKSGATEACTAAFKVDSHSSAAANNNIVIAVLTAIIFSVQRQTFEKKPRNPDFIGAISIKTWPSSEIFLSHSFFHNDNRFGSFPF